ncbi:MAG TPA: hypothetical protein DCM08_03910 [Microscillaceae bacterium]|nr:hypothetical protein [Microscillaceae bacterium]
MEFPPFPIRLQTIFKPLLGLWLLGLGACSNRDLNWAPKLYTPLAKSTLSIQNIPGLQNQVFASSSGNFNLAGGGVLGFTGTVPFVVPFSGASTTPATFNIGNNYVSSFALDTLVFSGRLTNPLPITLNRGMRIVIRNVGQATPAIVHTTNRDIPANGTYTFSETALNVNLNDNLSLAIEDIGSPGSATPVTFNPGTPLSVSYQFRFAIGSITFLPNRSIPMQIDDSFRFNFQNAQEITGDILLNKESNFPLSLQVQVLFLTGGSIVGAVPPTGIAIAAGTPASPTFGQTRVSASDLLNQLKTADGIRVLAVFTTPATPATINKNSALRVQLTADAQVKLNNQ